MGVVLLGLLSSARLRLWLARRLRLVERTEGDQEEEDGPLEEGGEGSTTPTGSKPNHQRASHGTATTVTALAEQRLRKAVQWICRHQQTEQQQQQEQRQQRPSRGTPPSPPRAPSRTQPTLSNNDRLARRSHSPPPPARQSFQPSRAARAHVAVYIAQICRQQEEEQANQYPPFTFLRKTK